MKHSEQPMPIPIKFKILINVIIVIIPQLIQTVLKYISRIYIINIILGRLFHTFYYEKAYIYLYIYLF